MENEQTICLTAEKAGRLIGYLFAYVAADEADIARVAVLKESRKQGVGSELMKELKKVGQEQELKKLLLDVRRSNTAARAFYKKLGFTEDGVRPGFYEKPEEDAVLMSCEIGAENQEQ